MKTFSFFTILALVVCVAEAGQIFSSQEDAAQRLARREHNQRQREAEHQAEAERIERRRIWDAQVAEEARAERIRIQVAEAVEKARRAEEARAERVRVQLAIEAAEQERAAKIADLQSRILKAKNRRRREDLEHELAIFITNPGKNTARKYGEFRCSKPNCRKRWASARAFMGYTQECSKCGTATLPHSLSDLKRSEIPIDTTVEHPAALCGRCIELGHACTENRY